jgi:hypothetical protein
MSVWTALAGGFAGTLVLTTTMAAVSHLRLTRMDIPFLLGTAFTEDRSRARVVGYALHFVAGLIFALISTTPSSWRWAGPDGSSACCSVSCTRCLRAPRW